MDKNFTVLGNLSDKWNIFNLFEYAVILLSLLIVLLILYYFLKETGILRSSDVTLTKESLFTLKSKHLMWKLHGLKKGKVLLQIILIVIVSRLTIFLLGYIATAIFENAQIGIFSSFERIWNRWDSPHYIEVARNGYTNQGEGRLFIVFYPFYPLLIRAFSYLTRGFFSAGLLVSNISLVWACYYLYKLTLIDFDSDTADRSVIFLLICPFSFFFGIVYTESLFLALTITCFYYIRKRKWFAVGLTGCLAALTKNQGVLILIPAAMEYIISLGVIDKIRQKQFGKIAISFLTHGACLFLIPLGLLLYLVLNKIFAGDWFMYLEHLKSHWHAQFSFFPHAMKGIFQSSLSNSGWDLVKRLSFWIPQLITFSAILLLILCSFNKLRVSYIAYMFVFLVMSFSSTWSISGARYASSIFPIYILFASFTKNRTLFFALMFFFTSMLAFYTIAFVRGFPVM